MTLTQLISILRAKLGLIITITFCMVVTAIFLSVILPKKYRATSAIIVNYKYTDPITGATIPPQLMPGYMATQVDIISSNNIALEVVEQLKLDQNKELVEKFQDETPLGEAELKNQMADYLLKGLYVLPSRTSNIIEMTYKNESPELAANVANGFADAFIKKSIEFTVNPSRNAASFYTNQIEVLKKNLEKANQEFSDYQQKNNIVNMDGSLDVETSRMNDLSQQLVLAQSQLVESQSRQSNVSRNNEDAPDIATNSVVQGLRSQLTLAEAKLAEVETNFDKNHPEFIAAKTQIDQLNQALKTQIKSATKTVSGNTSIFAQREYEIRNALNIQKQKVLSLNDKRSKLKILEQAVSAAQQAYNTASQKFTQNNFEGESNQSNITILNRAISPTSAYFPNLKINILAAMLAGLFFSIAYVIGRELLDRRIRSLEDLESILEEPSFGEYPKMKLFSGNIVSPKALTFIK